MTQRCLEALADAFADNFFDRYLACPSHLGHRVGEISRELYRKPRRLCVAHSECSLAWRPPTGGLELIDQQCVASDSSGAVTICIFSEWGVTGKFFGLLLACNQVLLV